MEQIKVLHKHNQSLKQLHVLTQLECKTHLSPAKPCISMGLHRTWLPKKVADQHWLDINFALITLIATFNLKHLQKCTGGNWYMYIVIYTLYNDFCLS